MRKARLDTVVLFGALALALAGLGGCALAPATVLPAVAGAAPVAVEDRGTRRRDSFWLAHYDEQQRTGRLIRPVRVS